MTYIHRQVHVQSTHPSAPTKNVVGILAPDVSAAELQPAKRERALNLASGCCVINIIASRT